MSRRKVHDVTPMTATPLTALDRCDRCGAQAYVRATLLSGSDLLFCAHHWRDHEAKIRPIATVHDETKRLDATPAMAGADEA